MNNTYATYNPKTKTPKRIRLRTHRTNFSHFRSLRLARSLLEFGSLYRHAQPRQTFPLSSAWSHFTLRLACLRLCLHTNTHYSRGTSADSAYVQFQCPKDNGIIDFNYKFFCLSFRVSANLYFHFHVVSRTRNGQISNGVNAFSTFHFTCWMLSAERTSYRGCGKKGAIDKILIINSFGESFVWSAALFFLHALWHNLFQKGWLCKCKCLVF